MESNIEIQSEQEIRLFIAEFCLSAWKPSKYLIDFIWFGAEQCEYGTWHVVVVFTDGKSDFIWDYDHDFLLISEAIEDAENCADFVARWLEGALPDNYWRLNWGRPRPELVSTIIGPTPENWDEFWAQREECPLSRCLLGV